MGLRHLLHGPKPVDVRHHRSEQGPEPSPPSTAATPPGAGLRASRLPGGFPCGNDPQLRTPDRPRALGRPGPWLPLLCDPALPHTVPGTELGTQQALGVCGEQGACSSLKPASAPALRRPGSRAGGALGRLNRGWETVRPAHSVWMRMSLFLGSSTHLQMSSWVTGMAM